jgi:hypothetical protein
MTDFSYSATNGNFDAGRRAALVERLSQFARSGPRPAPLSPDVQLTAMAKWEQVKTLPIFMLIGMIGMGALFSQGGLGANFATCGGLALLGVPLLVLMVKLNQAHREAFVENEVAKGLARAVAEKKYRDTYCD